MNILKWRNCNLISFQFKLPMNQLAARSDHRDHYGTLQILRNRPLLLGSIFTQSFTNTNIYFTQHACAQDTVLNQLSSTLRHLPMPASWFKILYSLNQESLTIHTFHHSNVFVFRIYLLPCYSIVLPPSLMLCQAFSNQLK